MAGDTVHPASDGAVSGYAFGGGVGVGPARVSARRWTRPAEGRPERGFAVDGAALLFVTEGSGDEERSTAYAPESV